MTYVGFYTYLNTPQYAKSAWVMRAHTRLVCVFYILPPARRHNAFTFVSSMSDADEPTTMGGMHTRICGYIIIVMCGLMMRNICNCVNTHTDMHAFIHWSKLAAAQLWTTTVYVYNLFNFQIDILTSTANTYHKYVCVCGGVQCTCSCACACVFVCVWSSLKWCVVDFFIIEVNYSFVVVIDWWTHTHAHRVVHT